jgi:methylmalonyl-CoA mutase C-terminal domain/subunit
MEVIYTGLRKTPEMIVEAALQEDVDVIGISLLSGAHMTIFPRILSLIKDKGLEDVLVFGGGIIPDKDIADLKKQGVGELFTPGASTLEIVKYVRSWAQSHRKGVETAG